MSTVLAHFRTWRTWGFAAAGAVSLGCAPVPQASYVPPAPIALHWPDPAFVPERQCREHDYTLDELEHYTAWAELALWLPSTQVVELDREHRCIAVVVNSLGGGRAAELILRGVAVPRRTVLLTLEGS